MLNVLLILTAVIAVFFAAKYFRQKVAIRQLAESLASRTSILTHSKDFRGTNRNWIQLLEELNVLIERINTLDKLSSDHVQQIDTTLGSLHEGVLMIDRDNYILLANSILQNFFPDLVDSVGKRLESGLHSSDFLEFVRKVKKGEGSPRCEMVFNEGPQQIWMEVSAATLLEEGESNSPWYLFVLHDITQLKRLELVRKQFVANASHELKTPVSIIKGYSETLVSDHASMPTEDRDRFIGTIYRNAERLALLIDDLLSLSRLESDSLSLDFIQSDAMAWMLEFYSDYRSSVEADGRELRMAINAGETPATVQFDTLKLRQVFENLVENAKKYTPSSGAIEIGARVDNGDFEAWVLDQGTGVPERDLARIFERFYRVDQGRSRETGGTGLGLSIVKHIIELHRGRVWAENADDAGLKVIFRLPLALEAARHHIV